MLIFGLFVLLAGNVAESGDQQPFLSVHGLTHVLTLLPQNRGNQLNKFEITFFTCFVECQEFCVTQVDHIRSHKQQFQKTFIKVKNSYRAAVVDYKPLPLNFTNLEQGLMNNLKNMETFITAAHEQKVDIIVFPEYSLMSMAKIFITVPNPNNKVVPATNASYHKSLRTLSMYAIDNQMYISVCVLENYDSNGVTKKYNTNVVFDRNGTVVARYRKYNLFGENLDITEQPEFSFFDADFGVRMGHFICFDLIFQKPALTLIEKYNVTDIIFPSMWFSELPFLTAVQAQWMWANGNRVNVLAAGYNEVSRGCGGSGIHRGKSQGQSLYQMDGLSGSTLLIGDVPIGQTSLTNYSTDYVQSYNRSEGTMNMLVQPELPDFATEYVNISDSGSIGNDVNRRSFSKSICHNALCCTINMTMYVGNHTINNDTRHYRIVAFDGRRHFGKTKVLGGFQACGIVSCTNMSLTSCANINLNQIRLNDGSDHQIKFETISIEGNFVKEQSNVLPDIFLYPDAMTEINSRFNFLTLPRTFQFVNNDNEEMAQLTLNANRSVITCGIMSRVFSRDGTNDGYQINSSFTLVVLFSLVVSYYIHLR